MKNLDTNLLEFEYLDFNLLKKQIDLYLYDIVYGDNNISIIDKFSCEKGIVELKIIKKKKHNSLNIIKPDDELITIQNKENNNSELNKIKLESEGWVFYENPCNEENRYKKNKKENKKFLKKKKIKLKNNKNY